VEGGGAVMLMRWQWLWGVVFANVRRERGV
jgi:hypothetical protein